MAYRAPVSEIQFALMQEAGFQRLIDSGQYEDLSDDLLTAILDEAAKLANDYVAPANWDGDQTGAHLTEDGVKVPESFKTAYAKYIEGGWPTLAAPNEYGGQGLPLALSNAVTEMMNSNIGFQLCPMLSNGGIEAMAAHATEEQRGEVHSAALRSLQHYGTCADARLDPRGVLDSVFDACLADTAPFKRGAPQPHTEPMPAAVAEAEK